MSLYLYFRAGEFGVETFSSGVGLGSSGLIGLFGSGVKEEVRFVWSFVGIISFSLMLDGSLRVTVISSLAVLPDLYRLERSQVILSVGVAP